jgi:hypothetical protein
MIPFTTIHRPLYFQILVNEVDAGANHELDFSFHSNFEGGRKIQISGRRSLRDTTSEAASGCFGYSGSIIDGERYKRMLLVQPILVGIFVILLVYCCWKKSMNDISDSYWCCCRNWWRKRHREQATATTAASSTRTRISDSTMRDEREQR